VWLESAIQVLEANLSDTFGGHCFVRIGRSYSTFRQVEMADLIPDGDDVYMMAAVFIQSFCRL